jgi:hypothetical protein
MILAMTNHLFLRLGCDTCPSPPLLSMIRTVMPSLLTADQDHGNTVLLTARTTMGRSASASTSPSQDSTSPPRAWWASFRHSRWPIIHCGDSNWFWFVTFVVFWRIIEGCLWVRGAPDAPTLLLIQPYCWWVYFSSTWWIDKMSFTKCIEELATILMFDSMVQFFLRLWPEIVCF